MRLEAKTRPSFVWPFMEPERSSTIDMAMRRVHFCAGGGGAARVEAAQIVKPS